MESVGKPREKELILQVFSGGLNGPSVAFDDVRRRLDAILAGLPVRSVIIGWAESDALYLPLAQYLEARGVELLLWLPVFSDSGAGEAAPCVDIFGEEVGPCAHGSETFGFRCPEDPLYPDAFLQMFERRFGRVQAGGVFLDKIRTPSCSHGLAGVLSCFCPRCRAAYEELGLEVGALREEAALLRSGAGEYARAPFGATGYADGRYAFANPIWGEFLRAKSMLISRRVREIAGRFRARGMRVGLDVFAPFLAPFVGQDLPALQQAADFVKPMMYRITNAPAGLPYELGHLLAATGAGAHGSFSRRFCDMLGIRSEPGAFDLAFAAGELSALTSGACPVYAGIEVNRIESVAPADREYVQATMRALNRTDIKGYVLSWNVLSAPESNIPERGWAVAEE